MFDENLDVIDSEFDEDDDYRDWEDEIYDD
jgi:hypothetical protein